MSKYDIYCVDDDPVPYKGLLLYPIPVKKYFWFNYVAECLLVDVYSIPDPKVISMKYFEYLYHYTNNDNLYIPKLNELMRMCTRNDETQLEPGEFNGKSAFKWNDIVYGCEDFDEIRLIISEQNMLELPNDKIQKELREEAERQRKFRQKLSGYKMAGLEDLLISISVATGISWDGVRNLSIRKFNKYLKRVNEFVDYQIYKAATMSGFVEFKDKNFPLPWMRDLEIDDPFNGTAMKLGDAMGKMSAGNTGVVSK